MARDCVCDATGILGRKQKQGLAAERIVERSSAMTFENIMCRLDIPPLPLISFDFFPLLICHSTSLRFSSRLLFKSEIYLFPISLSSSHPSCRFLLVRLRQCEIVHLPMIYCVLHPYGKICVIASPSSIIKRYLLNTRERVPS